MVKAGRWFLVVAVVFIAVASSVAPAQARTLSATPVVDLATAPTLVAPVDSPVVEGFDAPSEPWLAGHRGVTFQSSSGDQVHAAASGTIAFSGQVANAWWITVQHAHGWRTSYGSVGSTAVDVGSRVEAGQVIGTATGPLHFGLRSGDAYVDPAPLFGTPGAASLVDPGSALHAIGDPGLLDAVNGALGAGALVAWNSAEGVGNIGLWTLDLGRTVGSVVIVVTFSLDWPTIAVVAATAPYSTAVGAARLSQRIAGALSDQGPCTAATDVIQSPGSGRVIVLVGGLGSTSDDAAIDKLDTESLGYATGDTIRFSYVGGSTLDNSYESVDTTGDIAASGDKLADLLRTISGRHPGMPIDVIGHSQGGLVARYALQRYTDLDVSTLVTIATPHHGSLVADAAARGRTEAPLPMAYDAATESLVGFDPASTAVRQLQPGSDFLRQLNDAPAPSVDRFVAIGARSDIVVPLDSTQPHVAEPVTVAVDGLSGIATAHDAAPAARETRRAVATAISGRPTPCRSDIDRVRDAIVSGTISDLEAVAF